ncbi:molecular chaperone [Pseudomonas sp. BCA14]|nr:molecular chaperone [Pseudomonas sp. JMN1]TFF06432.1 molecular chaperone [Pseudomonas sp. BCA17]TFF22421.1 molecular chaperone [Pseudomonas sp. BCA14]TFF26818.1 molecular chaperone [Pseudomonas sp. BCA13]
MNATSISYRLFNLMALAFALFGGAIAHASVVINNTRIIYPQNDKEVTVRLESKNQSPVLIQAWLDNGDEHSTPDLAGVPFIATPPIFRMEPGKQQVVRLAYTGESLPSKQESLFWFNLLEVPAQAQDAQQANQLQLAFRSRIKLFFRPPNLPYGVEAAPGKLQWRRESTEQGQVLEVYNPTPYHVTFEDIDVLESKLRHARKTAASSTENMVAPGGRNRFEVPSLKSPPGSATTVEFQTLDDFGVKTSHRARISM